MAITLDAVTLPDDLIWTDEFTWSPINSAEKYTLTGALIIESGTKLKGRPITLDGDDGAAWIDRATLLALNALVTANAIMTLTTNDGASYQVVFDNKSNPLQAKPVIDYNLPISADFYTLNIKLMEV
jgi:hypothetical protein